MCHKMKKVEDHCFRVSFPTTAVKRKMEYGLQSFSFSNPKRLFIHLLETSIFNLTQISKTSMQVETIDF